jgi:type I restriction enzyme S subunit
MIAKMEIPLPPINEQIAIVNALEGFDTHIANLAELIEKKKAIRDGALEDLVSGRTRLPGFYYK